MLRYAAGRVGGARGAAAAGRVSCGARQLPGGSGTNAGWSAELAKAHADR
jgi:hypothetical protein